MTQFGKARDKGAAQAQRKAVSGFCAGGSRNKGKSEADGRVRGQAAGRSGRGAGDVALPAPRSQAAGRSGHVRAGGIALPDSRLQQLAARVQRQEEGSFARHPANSRHGPQGRQQLDSTCAAPQAHMAPEHRQMRHLQSSVADLLQPAQDVMQGAWEPQGAAIQTAGPGEDHCLNRQLWAAEQQPHVLRQQPMASSPWCPAPEQQPAAMDFSKRNMARLGGEGVAGIFASGPTPSGSHKAAASGFMSALNDLKAGLSDSQRAKQAAQREQLKRDLEEQMQQKKAAEAKRKAQQAAEEAAEEERLRAYWAKQAQMEEGSSAGGSRPPPGSQAHRQQPPQQGMSRGAAAAQGPARASAGSEPAVAGNGARRGEALVQPGIAVFLPPDKEAERRGALRAQQARQTCSEDAEDVRQLVGNGSQQARTMARAGGDPQVLALLREVQQEQQRMREQFNQQLDVVSRLTGDAVAARSERDRARQDLERVQRLLAERQGMGGGGVGMQGWQADDCSVPDMMEVTTQILPLAARRIPSCLEGSMGEARSLMPSLVAAGPGVQAAPVRQQQQALEPLHSKQPRRASGAASGAGRPGHGTAKTTQKQASDASRKLPVSTRAWRR